MDAIISIVIPVYNVEKYLDRCLESVTNQTYKNLEIILVDDGSLDFSLTICKSWEKKDNRIKVFHKENGGLSDARNYGVTKANGEYIFFIDSDDCMSKDTIETLYKAIIDNDAEIACCDYAIFSNDKPCFTSGGECLVANGGAEACNTMMSKTFMITAWANLIKKEIVVSNPYPVGRFQEDEATTYKYYYQSKKTVVFDRKLYGYFRNEKGIMKSPENYKKNVMDMLTSLKEQLDFYTNANEENLKQRIYTRYTRCYFEAYYKGYLNVEKKEAKLIAKQDIKNKKETFAYKIFLRAFLWFGKGVLSVKYK